MINFGAVSTETRGLIVPQGPEEDDYEFDATE